MPVKDHIGFGELTQKKMDDFSKIIRMHLKITQAVLNKYSNLYKPNYHYIDLTSGKGFSPNGVPGSPIVFLEQAERDDLSLSYRVDLIEVESQNIGELQINIENEKKKNGWNISKIIYHNCEYQIAIPRLLGKKRNEFGLAFIDTSGDLPDFDTLTYIAEKRPKMEILIYLASTNVKRVYQYTEKRLKDYIDSIGKKYWLIRKPINWDRHKWTFLLGSNAQSLFRDYHGINTYRSDSKRGQQILEELNLTKKEQIDSKQFKLDI